jgi:hypothetical protein
VGELDRIGQTAIGHHCPKLGQPSVGKEQSWQTAAYVQAHEAALEQPFFHAESQSWAVPPAGHRARSSGRIVAPYAKREPHGRPFLWFRHGRRHIILPAFFPTNLAPFAESRRGLDMASRWLSLVTS